MNENLDKLREQNRLVHSDILKDAIDKMELLIMDEDITNALSTRCTSNTQSHWLNICERTIS